MGVIPWRLGHSSAQSTAHCRLCDETRTPAAGLSSLARHLPHLVALVVAAIAGLFVLTVDRGPAGWLGGGVGVACGVVACGIYVWTSRRDLVRGVGEAHARELRALNEDADLRVSLVVKQFEWAVGDVARLRSELDATKATVRTLTERGRQRQHQSEQLVRQISRLRERLAEIAMAASLTEAGKSVPSQSPFDAIYFTWGLHLDGPRARLELQTLASADSPTRVRVMDRDGQVVAVSSTAVVSMDGTLEFQVEPPLDLIADLDEAREVDYAIEALVEHEWKPVRLKDTGRRTTSAVDVQGRLSRMTEVRDERQVAITHERGSMLN